MAIEFGDPKNGSGGTPPGAAAGVDDKRPTPPSPASRPANPHGTALGMRPPLLRTRTPTMPNAVPGVAVPAGLGTRPGAKPPTAAPGLPSVAPSTLPRAPMKRPSAPPPISPTIRDDDFEAATEIANFDDATNLATHAISQPVHSRPAAPVQPLAKAAPLTAATSASTKIVDDRENEFSNKPSDALTGEGQTQTLDLVAGSIVGQYEIIKELGRGGMGQVFMARDTRLGRVVAIKFLTRGGESFTKRFLVEAQTTARCTHENIVVIHEASAYRSHPFMVLEFLEGQPLSKVIKGRTLSPSRTIEIMVPVVRALIRAHAFGIVHRDLKPDNIFITESGTVKVLDFGVAKLFGENENDPVSVNLNQKSAPEITGNLYETLSTGGRVVGTLPFMSPEQFGGDEIVDERTDLWACGIIMFRLLSGQHPLSEVSNAGLMFSARNLDEPHRSLGVVAPSIPDALIRVVDKLLRKRKVFRYDNADALLADLEALLPTKAGRRLGDEECPYLGLSAFEENDADRFFGRAREVSRAVGLLRDNALLAIVGPSGAGKSSFVRAGLIPELKSQGIHWETFIIRPGRDPFSAVAALIDELTGKPVDRTALISRLHHEPGYLGQVLRDRTRQKSSKALLLVDQFEELYTLVADPDERNAFTRVMHGVADEPSSPLRLVLSLRSDFLHRIAETQTFADTVMRGLLLLGPPDKEGLREAVVGPAEKADYAFESESMVEEILRDLRGASAPYPLMQFCLSNLWAARDMRRRVLPYAAFEQMGGVAGALASHADQIIATLSESAKQVARALFQRLVTSEGTRAIVDLDEVESTSPDPAEVRRVLTAFVDARLLVSHQDTRTVEIVHEALVQQWPTLRRWMDEGREDVALIEQVRLATKQWDAQGRDQGLLWRGQSAKDAALYKLRFGASLAAKERDYLDAVIKFDRRSGRRKNMFVVTAFVVLGLFAAALVVGIIAIRGAQNKAQKQAAEAELALTKLNEAQAARDSAQTDKAQADKQVAMTAEQLAEKNAELEATLATVQKAKDDAIAAQLVSEEATKVADRARSEAERAKSTAQAAESSAKKAQTELAANLKEAERKLRDAQAQLAKYR